MLNRTVAPATLPVGYSECKADLRYTESDQDSYILQLVKDATDYVDGPLGALGRALITQTWELRIPCLWDCIKLPVPPVQSIQSISYYDKDNEVQALDLDTYILVADNDSAELVARSGSTLPGVYDRPEGVTITFVCGYGDSAEDVPADIRRIIRLMAAHWFLHASPTVSGAIVSEVPFTAQMLIDTHRLGWVA